MAEPHSPPVGSDSALASGTSFVWISRVSDPPARWDLRLLGWRMLAAGDSASIGLPQLIDRRSATKATWRRRAPRALLATIGEEDTAKRLAMLRAGLGDAFPERIALAELAVRLTRLTERAAALPRYRLAGPAMLDLFHRDVRIGRRWLGLHPREFGLLWRLAEAGGQRVCRRTLLQDVWRLAQIPDTNSLEVHISRLRAKLSWSCADWLVETDPRGGYRLGNQPEDGAREGLDTAGRLDHGGGTSAIAVSPTHAE